MKIGPGRIKIPCRRPELPSTHGGDAPDTASDPRKPKPSAEMAAEMKAAAAAAVELIEPGAVVGLGTGRTAGHVLPLLAARDRSHTLRRDLDRHRYGGRRARPDVGPFTEIDRLDIAIDGADQIAPDGWLIKGGGGAQTRERIVAAAADRFVVIAASDKEVRAGAAGAARVAGVRPQGHAADGSTASSSATPRSARTAA